MPPDNIYIDDISYESPIIEHDSKEYNITEVIEASKYSNQNSEENHYLERENNDNYLSINSISSGKEQDSNELITNPIFNTILLVTIIGEFMLPWLLKYFYKRYNSLKMSLSVLGSPESPVRVVYNIWLVWLGIFLSFTAFVFFFSKKDISMVLSILILLCILCFSIGAGIVAGFFSVNESEYDETQASKIHNTCSAIGFTTLLFFPLLNGIVAFKQSNVLEGIVNIISFILAFIFFVIFIMGEKDKFKDTVLSYKGLWERLTLFSMYIPFIYQGIRSFL